MRKLLMLSAILLSMSASATSAFHCTVKLSDADDNLEKIFQGKLEVNNAPIPADNESFSLAISEKSTNLSFFLMKDGEPYLVANFDGTIRNFHFGVKDIGKVECRKYSDK